MQQASKFEPKSIENCIFLGRRFQKDFGRVSDGFGDAQNLDFRTFFDDFSMSFSKLMLKGSKIASRMRLPSLSIGVSGLQASLGGRGD